MTSSVVFLIKCSVNVSVFACTHTHIQSYTLNHMTVIRTYPYNLVLSGAFQAINSD